MSKGYITINRDDFDEDMWTEKRVFSRWEAWTWMIEQAKYKDCVIIDGLKTVNLKRGQLYHSIRFMATAWSWSPSRVSRFLEYLRDRGRIKNETESGTVARQKIGQITICNYECYGDVRYSDETANETESGTVARQKAVQNRNKVNKEIINNNTTSYEVVSSKDINNTTVNTKKTRAQKFDTSKYLQLEPVVLEWIDYKVARHEMYKTQKSLDAFARMLWRYSSGDVGIATQVIEEAMGNNWMGIQKPKNNGKATNSDTSAARGITDAYKLKILRTMGVVGGDGTLS